MVPGDDCIKVAMKEMKESEFEEAKNILNAEHKETKNIIQYKGGMS